MTAGRHDRQAGHRATAWAIALAVLLSGCAASPPPPSAVIPAFITDGLQIGPDGLCYATDTTPAVIETVTAQVQDQPAVLAADGTVVTPASYRTVTRQAITRERTEIRFETLCPPAYTEDFVQSLQRALALRGFYDGPVTGVMDVATGRAVQDFQREGGPDSPILSIAAARTLGLARLTQDEIDRL